MWAGLSPPGCLPAWLPGTWDASPYGARVPGSGAEQVRVPLGGLGGGVGHTEWGAEGQPLNPREAQV